MTIVRSYLMFGWNRKCMETLKTVCYCCSILMLIFVFNNFIKIKNNYLLCYHICYLLDTETNNNLFVNYVNFIFVEGQCASRSRVWL